MPGPSLELEMRLRDRLVQFAMDQLAASEEKVDRGLGKISRSARQAENELNRFAKQTEAIHGAPVERFAGRFKKLEDAFASGKLSLTAYSSAMAALKTEADQAQAEFDGTAKKVRELAAAEQQAASRAEQMAKIRRNSIQLEFTENLRLNKERKAGLGTIQEMAQAQMAALGPAAIGQLTAMAGGYLTLQTAVNLVADAFRHARKESEDALASLRGLDDPRRKLGQMASSSEELAAMLRRADTAAAAEGIDRAKAYDVLFQAKSFGFEKDFERILAGNEVIDAQAAAKLSGKVATMFGGKITGREAINMALAAGKPSEVDAESIAGSLAMALEGGRRVGATPDETFALVSVLSAAFKSPDVAADRIKAITNRMAQTPKLKDAGGIMEGFERLKAMRPAERQQILKTDQETNAIYEALLEFEGKVRQVEAQVRAARLGTGGREDALSKQLGIVGGVPQFVASLMSRRAERRKEIAGEDLLAVEEAQRKSTADLIDAASKRRGGSGVGRFWMARGVDVASQFTSSPAGAIVGAGFANAATQGIWRGLVGDGLVNLLGRGKDDGSMLARDVLEVLKDIRDQGRGMRGRQLSTEARRQLN